MSKLHYLLGILVLAVVGYVLVGQINTAGRTAYEALTDKVITRIRFNIQQVYQKLKRYPDADKEFETMVLGNLSLEKYSNKVRIHKFIPGNAVSPATITIHSGGSGQEVTVTLLYYGSKYYAQLSYRGTLIKTPGHSGSGSGIL